MNITHSFLKSIIKRVTFGTVAGIAFFAVGIFVASAFTTVQPGEIQNPTFGPTGGNVQGFGSASPLNVQGVITSIDATNANNRHLTFKSGNADVGETTWNFFGGHGGGGYFGISENTKAPAFVIQAASGNVGIGTTSPSNKLHIAGGNNDWQPLRVGSTNGSGVGISLLPADTYPGFSVWAGANGSGYANKLFISRIVDATHASELMTLDSGGNVGIGTTSPKTTLDVAGTINATGFTVNGAPLSVGTGAGTTFNTITEVGGNVGIGTTSPQAKLHVVGTEIKIDGTTSASLALQASGGGAHQYTMSAFDSGNFGIDDATASARRLTIDNSGNVGIGTTSPNKQLHVKTASGNAEIDLQSAASPFWGIYQDDATDQLRFWNTDNRFVITPAGNVGIGTENPQAKLDVSGDVAVSGTLTVGGKKVTPGWPEGHYCILKSVQQGVLNAACPAEFTETTSVLDPSASLKFCCK